MDAPQADIQADGREGYSGVSPGEADAQRKPRRPNRVTWIGFQSRGGGASRVFVQLTSDVPYSQELRDDTLVVKLDGARYANSNTGRRLDTRYFESALQQVIAKRVGRRRARGDRPARSAGIELRITFKNPDDARQAEASLRTEQDGYHYLYLDFDAPGLRVSRDGERDPPRFDAPGLPVPPGG